MKFSSPIVKVAKFLFNVFELYIPMLSFTTMFLAFVLSIFFRYALNNPLMWPFEYTILGFIWTAAFGATYTRRHHAHVKFTLTYDKASPNGKARIRIAGNALIALLFSISFYPSLDYILFMGFQKTTVLRIPFSIAYFPYIIFLVLIIGHCVYDIVNDIKTLTRGGFQE